MLKYTFSIFLLVASIGSYATDLAYKYKTLKVDDIKLINDQTAGVDSVSVNDDGSKVCWVAKNINSKYLIRNSIFHMDLNKPKETKTYVAKSKFMSLHARCTFDYKDNLILSELAFRPGAIIRSLFSIFSSGELEPLGYTSSFVHTDKWGKVKRRVTALELGHKKSTVYIKHPKISPNSKWVAYYTHENDQEMGIYLVHIETGKVHKITNLYDKHPMWSPDGSRILFHHQRKVDGIEMSYLGYYDLEKLDKDEVLAKRTMIDNTNKVGYSYHKHPVQYPKSNIIYFHGQIKPDGKKYLFARKLEKNSKIYKVKMKYNETKFKNSKHPHTSKVNDGLFFVGKTKKDKRYNIYKLDYDGTNFINLKILKDN
jgi:hypothetical protein